MVGIEIAGWEFLPEIILLGAIIGASYGLLAVGLVLVFRSNRLVNFSHAEVGAFAATMLYLGVNVWGLPYYVVLPAALAIAAAISVGVEGIVIGRLEKAPPLMSVVATLGVGQLLAALAAAINTSAGAGFGFPRPPGMPTFTVGILRLTQDYTATLILAPLIVVALSLFLTRTRAGLRVRSTASNRDAARLAGIPAVMTSRTVWALAGVLAAVTAILVAPSKGPGFAAALGPGLLLRGLAPALVARMSSLPIALGAGVAFGIIEQVVFWNQRSTRNVDLILLVGVLLALVAQRQKRERDAGHGSWAGVETWRPIAAHLRNRPAVRRIGPAVAVTAILFAAVVPLLLDRSRSVTLASMVAYAVIALGLGLITGLLGQLSLGHFAIGAVAGTTSVIVAERTANFALGLASAAIVGGALMLILGAPALRIRGLFLAVTSLAFAVAASSWLLPQTWMLGPGREPPKPALGSIEIESARAYYWFALGVGVAVFILIAALRRGGFARVLIAIRDGEEVARSFGISTQTRRLQAYAISGAVAGIGGALYAHTFSQISTASFAPSASIDVAVMVVVGGATMMAGPLLGVLFVIGIPSFLPLDAAGLATTKLGLLILIVYVPGGLAQLVLPLRDRLVRLVSRGSSRDQPDHTSGNESDQPQLSFAKQDDDSVAAPVTPANERPVALGCTGLEKHYGGVRAVHDAEFSINEGEIVGLIGPNGAGKTTLFELLTGFTRSDGGSVVLSGRDITGMSPSARAHAGLVRSFQNSPLFPTLTVVECIATALERTQPTRSGLAAMGWARPERARLTAAAALAERFGLHDFADRQLKELSTGTRRICELACITALAPSVVLLDEPAAGLAQREVEALVPVLTTLRRELDCTMLVIEHDLPMLSSLCDRMIAMVAGNIVAIGTPSEVTTHPTVVAAYLGEPSVAVDRSGALT